MCPNRRGNQSTEICIPVIPQGCQLKWRNRLDVQTWNRQRMKPMVVPVSLKRLSGRPVSLKRLSGEFLLWLATSQLGQAVERLWFLEASFLLRSSLAHCSTCRMVPNEAWVPCCRSRKTREKDERRTKGALSFTIREVALHHTAITIHFDITNISHHTSHW